MTKTTEEQPDSDAAHQGDERTWVASGFTARVVKNEDDEGWAVTMTRDGDSEPVLTSPWTMGRDKKSPKPLNYADFRTLLKGALDVVTRHEAHAQAQRHRSVRVADADGAPVRIDLDIAADEDDPHAVLTAWGPFGEKFAERRVAPDFKLSSASASQWVARGFGAV
jgi:hypothetical protein